MQAQNMITLQPAESVRIAERIAAVASFQIPVICMRIAVCRCQSPAELLTGLNQSLDYAQRTAVTSAYNYGYKLSRGYRSHDCGYSLI